MPTAIAVLEVFLRSGPPHNLIVEFSDQDAANKVIARLNAAVEGNKVFTIDLVGETSVINYIPGREILRYQLTIRKYPTG